MWEKEGLLTLSCSDLACRKWSTSRTLASTPHNTHCVHLAGDRPGITTTAHDITPTAPWVALSASARHNSSAWDRAEQRWSPRRQTIASAKLQMATWLVPSQLGESFSTAILDVKTSSDWQVFLFYFFVRLREQVSMQTGWSIKSF